MTGFEYIKYLDKLERIQKNCCKYDWDCYNAKPIRRKIIKKAKILQRDSFVLWNVKSAVLYAKQGDSFSILKSWNDIEINSRIEVKPKENLWKTLLHTILEDLNNYFESGEISDEISTEILAVDAIIDVILENVPSTVENLRNRTRRNARLEAQISNWWLLNTLRL